MAGRGRRLPTERDAYHELGEQFFYRRDTDNSERYEVAAAGCQVSRQSGSPA
jgi:hypothetical protein